MDGNAYRDDDDGDVDQPDAYWRRRVITLALGLGLLGMLAWGFSGGGGKPKPASPSGTSPAAAIGTAVPGLAAGSPSAGSPVASGAATGSPPLTPSGTPLPGTGLPSARPSPSGAAASSGAAEPVAPGGRCAPGAVVLSLFSDRTSYGPSQYPRFEVYAVSTSAGRCAFDPGQLQVVVLSGGRIVWDSADCDHGGGRPVELTRGVPAQDDVTWNRAITLPGCQVLAPSARPGSYAVQARTATVQSPVRAFRLTGGR